MTAVHDYHHATELPWTRTPEERRRSRNITQTVLALFLLAGLLLPMIPLPELDRSQVSELPPRFARLIVEKQQPVPKPEPVVEKKEEKKPEPEKKVEKEKKKEPEKKPEPEPEPEVDVAAVAREKASRSGLLAMADELADLREVPDVPQVKLDMNKKPAPAPEAPQPEMLTMQRASSGGLDRSKLARATRPSRSLSERSTSKVDSAIEKAVVENAPRQRISGPRTIEQIRLVFEKNKGALNRLHSMALRRDPTLEGDVTLEIAIAAAGNVTSCRVVSSAFEAPRFLGRIETKCKGFDFGPATQDMTINYPLNFTPLS